MNLEDALYAVRQGNYALTHRDHILASYLFGVGLVEGKPCEFTFHNEDGGAFKIVTVIGVPYLHCLPLFTNLDNVMGDGWMLIELPANCGPGGIVRLATHRGTV